MHFLCAKYHNRSLLTRFIRANITHIMEHFGNSRLYRPRASVTASIEAPSPKSMEINFSVSGMSYPIHFHELQSSLEE